MVAPWVTLDAIPSPPDLPGTEEEVAAEWAAIIAQASEVVWALSGRRWSAPISVTREVVAPAPGCDAPIGWDPSWGMAMHPVVVDGQITNRSSCGCQAPPAVRLPGSPVEVTSVTVRGAVRDADSYRLRGAYLEDLTGRGWPTCDPGILVVYTSGKTPPEGGRRAAALLVKELALSRLGLPCQLPANVTSVTRQGITQTMVSAADLIEKGQTGVVAVDTWLAKIGRAHV